MSRKGLFIVMAKVPPEKDAAFNRWYNEDHLPKALERFGGVLSGRRYKIMEGEDEYQYLAIYEFESFEKMQETMKSEAAKQLIREYNEAFGTGNRRRVLAVEIKALAVA